MNKLKTIFFTVACILTASLNGMKQSKMELLKNLVEQKVRKKMILDSMEKKITAIICSGIKYTNKQKEIEKALKLPTNAQLKIIIRDKANDLVEFAIQDRVNEKHQNHGCKPSHSS